jgi:G6PDH family F420-dependent oxidoreductase
MPVSIPVGLNPTSIGVSAAWWQETARAAEKAGFSVVWCWDHFISRGDAGDQVLECWTTLAAAAAVTGRIGVGSWVTNVMNRHPSVLARMADTLQEESGGRLSLGLGVGGTRGEHERLGIAYPPAAERAERLEEAVQVLRALFVGGPVSFEGRHYRLSDAVVHPTADPPRIVVAGQTPAGARLAARVGDAWTTDAPLLSDLLGPFEDALAKAGRSREQVPIVLAVPVEERGEPLGRRPILSDLGAEAERWRERGADELILAWVRPEALPAVLDAAERAGLADR